MFKELIFKSAKWFGANTSLRLKQFASLIDASIFFHKSIVPVVPTKYHLYDFVIKKYGLDETEILFLEFGVFKGDSIKYWSKKNRNNESLFFGFDSFEGLPQKWGIRDVGSFSTDGKIPLINDTRISFIKGWYSNTLSDFIESNSKLLRQNKIINMDSDLYTSTLYVLYNLSKFIIPGDFIFFDDFFTIRNNAEEFRAFNDFANSSNLKYDIIAKTNGQIVIEII
ncbi:MAG: hypothetical protein QG635_1670 [Bacteroidota bacterium]|nr:hypothetical protein [Bacteroidota bacterium]